MGDKDKLIKKCIEKDIAYVVENFPKYTLITIDDTVYVFDDEGEYLMVVMGRDKIEILEK